MRARGVAVTGALEPRRPLADDLGPREAILALAKGAANPDEEELLTAWADKVEADPAVVSCAAAVSGLYWHAQGPDYAEREQRCRDAALIAQVAADAHRVQRALLARGAIGCG
ncbi:hypothetical protein [Sorangium sp. So ce131]|uniref:hypothetical protein n=1 Tax=Sorangium sp. So ce131 TaxID=3133282 RepID=UPI003F5DFF8E